MNFTEFGWNGINFEVPEDARFTRFAGDAKRGSFMFESDEYLIEGKWEPIPKRRQSISVIATTLIEKMGEQYKKRGRLSSRAIKVLEKRDARVYTHDALFMVVKEQVDERFYLWYCDESNRIVIMRFIFKTFDENSRKIIRKVIESFICHKEDPNVWSLLNFSFEAPKDFYLTEAKIAVGRAHFVLTAKKVSSFSERISTLIVDYYSLANVVFKDTYKNIDEWFKKNYEKDLFKQLKKRKIKFVPEEQRKLLTHDLVIKNGISKSGMSWRSTTLYTNLSWYCQESNRIYTVTMASSLAKPIFLKRKISEIEYSGLLESLLSSFKCHT
ncbi:hypothetical protein KEJ18_04900 [Candidatus Bathyarchaeota archaeon]|nr:hypothetical protein [Candidatus Bathyarchaeota archaeon]